MQKQKELKDSLSAAMQQAHNAYTLALRALRAEEDMHFQECVPSLMDQLQAWHVSINGELSEAIAGYAELLKGRWEDLSQEYEKKPDLFFIMILFIIINLMMIMYSIIFVCFQLRSIARERIGGSEYYCRH